MDEESVPPPVPPPPTTTAEDSASPPIADTEAESFSSVVPTNSSSPEDASSTEPQLTALSTSRNNPTVGNPEAVGAAVNNSGDNKKGGLQDLQFADDIEDEIQRKPRIPEEQVPVDLEEAQPPISSPVHLLNKTKSGITESTKVTSETRDNFEDEEQSFVSKQSRGGISTKSKSSVKKPRTPLPPPPPPPPPKLSPYVNVALVVAILFGIVGTVIGIIGIIKLSDDNGGANAASGATDAVVECMEGTDCFSEGAVTDSLLEVVRERGYIKCGMLFEQLGFFGQTGVNMETEEPIYAGLDVDLCSALSAAIFNGDSEAYQIQMVFLEERWTVLNSTDIDVLFRSTRTMERDVYEPSVGTGFEFSTPYFYDGLGFGGVEEFVECAENTMVNGTCADLRICVIGGTTHETVVKGLVPEDNIVVARSSDDFYESFPNTCNVIAGERTFISRAALRQRGYQGPYVLGTRVYSQEPLCMVTRRGDPRWTDFVEAVLNGLILAEVEGFTQSTANRLPTSDVFGAEYENILRDAVLVRGNYGELYGRNLEAFIPRGGLNLINRGDAPRLYTFPFGNLETRGSDLVDSSPTIKGIMERGYLHCGVTVLLGHGNFNATTQEYTGFQVDLCKAISAALFYGVDRTRITAVAEPQRVTLLYEGRYDIATFNSHTWENDVKEERTGRGLAHSEPYFYAGFVIAGIPNFVECAQNLDIVSPECQELRICARPANLLYALFVQVLQEVFLVPKDNVIQMYEGLENGDCNVMAAGGIQIQRTPVGRADYDGPYVVGDRLFAIGARGMITREDDPVWSGFVEWVYSSLVYAEANGIDQANAALMPRTNVFGPLHTDMFYHAVNMVGNYGEVYDRNFAKLLPRSAIHNVNDNSQPRLFAF